MKPILLNKGEIKITLNLLQKIEHNLRNKRAYITKTDDYELYCAVQILWDYLISLEK